MRKMLEFAEKTMPYVDAQLWSDFRIRGELDENDLAHRLYEVVGLQRHFEEQLPNGSGEKLRIDHYIGKKIREATMAWREAIEEELEAEEDQASGAASGEGEWVTIDLPDNTFL